MRKLFILIILISAFGFNAYPTPQTPDLLIIGQDTFCLHTDFPIDELNLKINDNPFNKSGKFEIHSTACWRGYQAIWEIKNKKMYLNSMKSCHSDSVFDYSDVLNYFTKNGYEPKIENGKIVADWYTTYLVEVSNYYGFFNCDKCLESTNKLTEGQGFDYHIINGVLKAHDFESEEYE